MYTSLYYIGGEAFAPEIFEAPLMDDFLDEAPLFNEFFESNS
jgi:hypothetical protein